MPIYTKRGDKGETGLFGTKKRVPKNALRIEAIGAIDELNSFLGIIGGLQEIQADLFLMNAILSGSKLRFSEGRTKDLERQIDKIEKKLPPQRNFIYYSGTKKATLLFYARALCRHAERAVVALGKTEKVNPAILIFLNRLSDYLFILARKENHGAGIVEEKWHKSYIIEKDKKEIALVTPRRRGTDLVGLKKAMDACHGILKDFDLSKSPLRGKASKRWFAKIAKYKF